LNEPVPDDLTYVYSRNNPQGDTFEVKLAPLAWPEPGTVTLTVRLRKTDSPAAKVTLALLQGSTVLASQVVDPQQSFSQPSPPITLTVTTTGPITNYTDLRLRVMAPVAVGCCDGLVPALLKATFSNKTGTCTCLPDSMILSYSFGLQEWLGTVGPGPCGGPSVVLVLSCTGTICTDWFLSSPDTSLSFSAHPDSAGCHCNPLNLTFSGITAVGLNCSGSFTITITEYP
jgi:hypothetical protein